MQKEDFSGVCSKCHRGNVKYVRDGKCSSTDKPTFVWKYTKKSCRHKIAPCRGSFFSGSHLDYGTILCLIYCLIHGYSEETIKHELDIGSNHTIVDWYLFCRDVCIDILLYDNKKIGGDGHIVELDESKFGCRKYNRGKLTEGKWVIGVIDRQT